MQKDDNETDESAMAVMTTPDDNDDVDKDDIEESTPVGSRPCCT